MGEKTHPSKRTTLAVDCGHKATQHDAHTNGCQLLRCGVGLGPWLWGCSLTHTYDRLSFTSELNLINLKSLVSLSVAFIGGHKAHSNNLFVVVIVPYCQRLN